MKPISTFRLLTVALAVAFANSAMAQNLSPAEKIYAGIANLKGKERETRLLEGAAKEGPLHIASTLRGQLTTDETAMFRKLYPSVKIEVTDTGSQDAAEQLVNEETAGRHLTDIVELSIPDMRETLARNLQARYPTPVIDAILPQHRKGIDPQNRWVPFSSSEFGIVYNTDLLKPEDAPKTWDDICNPKYKGMMAVDAFSNRYLYGMYVMMGDAKFEKWMACLGANKPIVQKGYTQRLQLMLAGDHALEPDQYFFVGAGMKARDPRIPFGMVTTAPPLVSYLSVVINNNTPSPYAAALFADFHLTDEFQAYLAAAPRGPIGKPSPYLPADTPIVAYGFGTDADYDKLLGYWKKYIQP